jgi:hypothetical protein
MRWDEKWIYYSISLNLDRNVTCDTIVFGSIWMAVWPVTAASESDHSDRLFVMCDP